MIENCPMRHENGNCIPAGGFCTANKNICEALLNAYRMGNAQLFYEGTTSDLISRTATIDAVNNAFDRETLLTGLVRSIAVRAIRDMPSAQPEPKEGEWVQVSAQKYFTSASYFYRCSVCGENNPRNTKYCPNCGAKMTIDGGSGT